MSDSYESNIKKMRELFASRVVSEMTPKEINNTFQRLHDNNLAKDKRIAELEAENKQLLVIATNFQTGLDLVRKLDTGTAWVSKTPDRKSEMNAWKPIHRAELLLKEHKDNEN